MWFIKSLVSKNTEPNLAQGVPIPDVVSELLQFFIRDIRPLLENHIRDPPVKQIWIDRYGEPLSLKFFKIFLFTFFSLDFIGFNRFLTDALQCFFPNLKMGPADFRRCIPSLFFEAVIEADEDVERVMGEYAALVNTSLTVKYNYNFFNFF
jgi:hypothetical protein